MDDSIAVVAAKIGKRVTGSQFGEPERTAPADNLSLYAWLKAPVRGQKQLTHWKPGISRVRLEFGRGSDACYLPLLARPGISERA
jgi:hypothetical protein